MPLFSEHKYNNYVPQYVGAPLDEYLAASTAIQKRYDETLQGYSLVGELADTLETSPLEGDRSLKNNLVNQVNLSIEEAAKRGNFDQMGNEMRYLAKQYAKQAQPLKENAARYNAEQERILKAGLPVHQEQYLRSVLGSQKGLSYDENGQPQYIQPISFAEFFDTQKALNEFGSGYKEDLISKGFVLDPSGKFYNRETKEYIDPNEVINAMSHRLDSDSKASSFIMQDLMAKGIDPNQAETSVLDGKTQTTAYANELARQSFAQAEKLGFTKQKFETQDNDEFNIRLKQKLDEESGSGFTFDINYGVPARAGIATPSDLRSTANTLGVQRQSVNDEWNRWEKSIESQLGPIKSKVVNGQTRWFAGNTDITEERGGYVDRMDALEAQQWELQEVEAQAKIDAGLPANYVPNQKVLDQAEKDAEATASSMRHVVDRAGKPVYNAAVIEEEYRKAYNKSIDNSNDPNLKAYRKALSKNAKDRQDVKGVTTFGKAVRQELDRVGNQLLSGTSGILNAKDLATGQPITDLEDFGGMVETVGWTTNNGNLEIIYKTGAPDKNGNFIPSDKKVSVQAPPELVDQLAKKGVIDLADLEISRQIGDFGGKVKLGNFTAEIEIKRNAQTGPTPYVVTVDTEQGPRRVIFSSMGTAVKFINQASKLVNGN
jgi:hypothetical protein